MTTTAPYGTWTSPITADAITQNAVTFAEVLVDPVTSGLYHVENRAAQYGRSVVVNTTTRTDVTPDEKWNFRTDVQGYGGAASIVYDGIVYFSNYSDGRVYRVQDGGDTPEPITPDTNNAYRYANFAMHPIQTHLLVSILEDHTIDVPANVVNTLCVINTQTGTVTTFISGADFYTCPTFSPDGTKLAWQQWYFPDMSWQGAEVHIADVVIDSGATTLTIQNDTIVAGQRSAPSCVYPLFATNNNIIFTSDVSGYINPWKFTVGGHAEAIFPKPIEKDFGCPSWSLNVFALRILDAKANYAVFVAVNEGRDEIQIVDLESGTNYAVDSSYVVVENIQSLSKADQAFVFTGAKVDESTCIVRCDISLTGGTVQATFTEILAEPDVTFSKDLVSVPEPKVIKGTMGDVHIVFYPPHNPQYSGSSIEGELPPCVLNVHGGPTSIQKQGLSWFTQYFTSRGWAWMDVNYGGSSGYGTAYVERLNPEWGLLDPDDCISSAQAISSAPLNLVDPKRIAIRGQSSGGFTVMAALSYSRDLTEFGAGTSCYGISALKPLVTDTHKFESHYMDKLLGGTIQQIPLVYAERSPVNHADSIKSPLLLLQGGIDQVVPVEQSNEIYAAIKKNGGVVEYKIYPLEGHGWRKQSTMKDALEREIKFYETIFAINDLGPW